MSTETVFFINTAEEFRILLQSTLPSTKSTEDGLCFENYLGVGEGYSLFQISLISVVAIATIATCWLSVIWYTRRNWFPMRERSSYSTLILLLCCYLNFLIQPSILLGVSGGSWDYDSRGNLEVSLKLIYLMTRACIISIYIGKVMRLYSAFSSGGKSILIERDKLWYKFIRSEFSVLSAALLIAAGSTLAAHFPSQDAIVLVIERQYISQVQNFLVPMQCSESAVYITLLYLMKDIPPYYRINNEIRVTFLSNVALALFEYILFQANGFQSSFCNPHTNLSTFLVFAATQIRDVSLALLCVYIPLRNATRKPISLPDDTFLLQSVSNTPEAEESMLLLISLYGEQVSEPFVAYLKYVDSILSDANNENGKAFFARLRNIASKNNPLILQMKNFEALFQLYVCASMACMQENSREMRKVFQEYLEQIILHSEQQDYFSYAQIADDHRTRSPEASSRHGTAAFGAGGAAPFALRTNSLAAPVTTGGIPRSASTPIVLLQQVDKTSFERVSHMSSNLQTVRHTTEFVNHLHAPRASSSMFTMNRQKQRILKQTQQREMFVFSQQTRYLLREAFLKNRSHGEQQQQQQQQSNTNQNNKNRAISIHQLLSVTQDANNLTFNNKNSDVNNGGQQEDDAAIALEQQKIALIAVQEEVFIHLHFIWKNFYSRTKSFAYLQKMFESYGVARNYLQDFHLTNSSENLNHADTQNVDSLEPLDQPRI